MRVGIGYDIHPLKKGRPLVLGGICIPYPKGLDGHSDGDALVHAIGDAILGAGGLGDLGLHFPSTPKHKDISSLRILDRVQELIRGQSLRISHIDSVVVAQKPSLSPFRSKIARSLARRLKIRSRQVSVKAKTNDGLGLVGREKAVAAFAIATLIPERRKNIMHVKRGAWSVKRKTAAARLRTTHNARRTTQLAKGVVNG
ncbi:MAG: 2-C-methyl-D-erythritol 2,4-cyclodiphosphate synthase [Candidatus Omnitrophica bacterium]|nr:2-C-methyl-D-erythritol 2,4-cyclodiphosphate synthase [Candidatus Omnitrophota bacterium]